MATYCKCAFISGGSIVPGEPCEIHPTLRVIPEIEAVSYHEQHPQLDDMIYEMCRVESDGRYAGSMGGYMTAEAAFAMRHCVESLQLLQQIVEQFDDTFDAEEEGGRAVNACAYIDHDTLRAARSLVAGAL